MKNQKPVFFRLFFGGVFMFVGKVMIKTATYLYNSILLIIILCYSLNNGWFIILKLTGSKTAIGDFQVFSSWVGGCLT